MASDHLVLTVLLETWLRASEIAPSTSIKPSFGFGIIESIDLFGSATTSLIREPTKGRASEVGTGVTKPIQRLESFGVSTGTLIIKRLLRPDNLANFCIISAYDKTSGPPISKIPATGFSKVAVFRKYQSTSLIAMG